jgi:class 3 adenylate cyclase
MTFRDTLDADELLHLDNPPVRDLYLLHELRQPVPESVRDKDGKPRIRIRQIPWLQESLKLARLFVEKALAHEEFLLVCDVADETLRHWNDANSEDRPELVKVSINYARALTRLGYTRRARELLKDYAQEEGLNKLGRQQKIAVFMELGEIMREESQQATIRRVRVRTAEQAGQFYARALDLDRGRLDLLALTACASLIAGEPGSEVHKAAHERAKEILDLTEKREDDVGVKWQTTWARAAANTVLGRVDEAHGSYSQLKSIEGVTTKLLADIRYKTRFLAEALGMSPDLFKPDFPALQLIVFAGHLPDPPGEKVRFPRESIGAVREMLRVELESLGARAGLVSAAAGADLLFIEALRERQGTLHLVLPWSREEFRETSVDKFDPAGEEVIWGPRFEKALAEAATIREMGDSYFPSRKETWQYTMEVTAGLAMHTARVSRLDVQPVVLWDTGPAWGPGGTASFFEFWEKYLRRKPVIIKLPAPDRCELEPIEARKKPPKRSETSIMHQEVKSMLFADIVGYSKLREKVIPAFVETFMHRVSMLASTSKHAPRYINTWGDAVYAVFDFARDAGCFAIELTQMIQDGEKDWVEKELYWKDHAGADAQRHSLNIRIGLHTGPVFMHYDPVVRQIGFTGAHVSRAARIEPVTKPGEIFASEEFAALAALDTEIRRLDGAGPQQYNPSFVCEFAGHMQLAKGYPGRFRVYRVRPKPVLAVEELARAVHDAYRAQGEARGETLEKNTSLRPWEELPEGLKKSNREQVEDIPEKLDVLGYELTSSGGIPPSHMKMTDAQIEELAIREHDRFVKERRREGWEHGPNTIREEKISADLTSWDQVTEPARERDRVVVRSLPALLQRAGLRVRKYADRDNDPPVR